MSDVYPECADEACNKRRKEEIEKNPVKVRRLTRLLSRHWDEWRENIRHHVMVADLQSKRVVDVTPGDFDSPPGQAEDNAIAFSPDGKELAFVSNREGNDREAWTTNNDVFLVPVTGGSARKLTPGTGADNQPVFSRRRFARCSCAPSGAAASSPIAGISTPTTGRAAPSASSSNRRTSRSATTRSRPTAARSGSSPANRDARTSTRCRRPAARRSASPRAAPSALRAPAAASSSTRSRR